MQSPEARYTLDEIRSQPEAWEQTLSILARGRADLRSFLDQGGFDSVLFTGCGSTYYLAEAAASALREIAGLPAQALPGSEIWLNASSAYMPTGKPLLVVASRSGETTESLRACEAFRARSGGGILTFSCYPSSALTHLGDHNILILPGQEQSYAQTRAFTTLYLGTVSLAAVWAGREDLLEQASRLPDACRQLLDSYTNLGEALGSNPAFDRFYFLGSGLLHGLAREASLKMKEMSLSHSEPFHFLEFRHGPKTMVNESTLVVGLVSGRNAAQEMAVLDEAERLGGKILSLGERGTQITFASGLSEPLLGALYLPVLQTLAYYRAVTRGQNPDRPRNLTPVIQI